MALSEFERFQRKVAQALGVDLSGYRTSQLLRRLDAYLARQGMTSLDELAASLMTDSRQRQAFNDFLTINVSEFFRDPEKYRVLGEEILPLLLKEGKALDVWSAGCSVGAEPYSVAMVLEEARPGLRHRILGTDVDAQVLQIARAGGPYSEAQVRHVPSPYRGKYLLERTGQYWVGQNLRSKVTFRRHDLLRDPFVGEHDLIVCRNVVIYFSEEAKERLYLDFARCLKPGGFLFVGPTEILLNARSFGLVPYRPSFYRKVSG